MRENLETELRSQVVEKENNLKGESKRANDLEARAVEAEHAVKILQQSLELAKANVIKATGIIDGLSSENTLLKAEVQRVTDLRNEEKAALPQQIDDAVETAIDKTLFRVWSQNPGVLNLNFLREELEPTLARWEKKLEEEEAEDTIVEATDDGDEDDEDEASSLKTGRDRLTKLKEMAHEVFRETPPAEPETSIPPPVDEPSAKDVTPVEDGAPK